MAGLPAPAELAIGFAIELGSPLEQLADLTWSLSNELGDRIDVPEAAGDLEGVGDVLFAGILVGHRRGNPALGLGGVGLKGTFAVEAERFQWGKRIREVEQGPKGAMYVLEDGTGGRLLKLIPGQ